MAALSGPGWSRQAGFLLAGDLVKMRAAVLTGVNTAFRVAEVDLAPPRAGEVLVRVAASRLCRSDLNAIPGKRTLLPFPALICHEASGGVVDFGPGVGRLPGGAAVVLSSVALARAL